MTQFGQHRSSEIPRVRPAVGISRQSAAKTAADIHAQESSFLIEALDKPPVRFVPALLLFLLQVAYTEPTRVEGKVIRVADGDTLPILSAGNVQQKRAIASWERDQQ